MESVVEYRLPEILRSAVIRNMFAKVKRVAKTQMSIEIAKRTRKWLVLQSFIRMAQYQAIQLISSAIKPFIHGGAFRHGKR